MVKGRPVTLLGIKGEEEEERRGRVGGDGRGGAQRGTNILTLGTP